MQRVVCLALALVVAAGCNKESAEPKPAAPAAKPPAMAVDINNPEECTMCHPAIVAEWKQSMHASSHHSRDPIYAGVRAIRAKKEGADITKACAGCHTPGFEAEPEAEAAAIGIGCATCHNARVGAAPGQLLGPSDVPAGVSPAHATGPAHESLADGTGVCKGCHEALQSPTGVSMCATGAEHATIEGEDSKSCGSCHMPRTAGAPMVTSQKSDHASHAFLGPHRAWYQDDPSFAASAIDVSATLVKGKLKIDIVNKSGHAFPTGFPGRMAIVSCVGHDDKGADVWQCEPKKLGKVYVDADGKRTLAPYAAKLDSDTRIAPGSTETYEFDAPSTVAKVDVIVSMRLLPESLAAKLKLEGAPEGAPKAIAEVAAARSN
jgi:hypothetical protein